MSVMSGNRCYLRPRCQELKLLPWNIPAYTLKNGFEDDFKDDHCERDTSLHHLDVLPIFCFGQ